MARQHTARYEVEDGRLRLFCDSCMKVIKDYGFGSVDLHAGNSDYVDHCGQETEELTVEQLADQVRVSREASQYLSQNEEDA